MKRFALFLLTTLFVLIAQAQTLTGTVKDVTGEGLTGASVAVLGTTNGTNVDIKGQYKLTNVKKGSKIKFSFIGYKGQTLTWNGEGDLNVVLEEESTSLEEAVVTAMGIVRKATSLTYSTQQLKSDDLMKVQDPNLVNSMEGKISGVTITASAGGAGGASKILLRGNKSILGNNSPLIVVDGVPMTNNTRGQMGAGTNIETASGAEGSDPLSMINPDDIESMNVLKGANAAALYGSQAANGVVMITTKKGKEGRLDVNFTSNVTFDTPLLTPAIQNEFGGYTGSKIKRNTNSWGRPVSDNANPIGNNTASLQYITTDTQFNTTATDIYGQSYADYANAKQLPVHVRTRAKNDVKDFYELGVTTNNSISLSGGTEKMKNYFSYANSYADGMVPNNNYIRNTFALRQNYTFWKRVYIDVNANYVTTRTKNRVGGGTNGNPLYDLYLAPRDVDMDYYREHYATEGYWRSSKEGNQNYYEKVAGGGYKKQTGFAYLNGTMQNWAMQDGMRNNPYWLLNMNTGVQREDRFYGSAQGKVDIYDGLAFQARVSIDQTKFNSESHAYATTMGPNVINAYGAYSVNNSRTSEVYTDYLLSYNKTFKEDWSVSATAGWVAHTLKGVSFNTYSGSATYDLTGVEQTVNGTAFLSPIPTMINVFDPQSGTTRQTRKSRSSNWDKAALATVQFGWKDMVYLDGSYRRDWYRAFRQKFFDAPDNYGYFGFGGSAILSQLLQMAEPVSYLKYRLSYSEVGNSIPNQFFGALSYDFIRGTYTGNTYNPFIPVPEKTKSFETGFESQFFNNALNLDVTYYNSAMCNSWLTIVQGSRTQALNSGKIRNQGIELTVGYDWHIGRGWRWKTSVNFSYNHNKVLATYLDKDTGASKPITQGIAKGVDVRYIVGSGYGDIYSTIDFDRYGCDVYSNNGVLSSTPSEGATLVAKKGDIYVKDGKPGVNNQTWNFEGNELKATKNDAKFLGNMNSPYQLSWSNTFSYKNFNLYFLVNGRIGGKVMSLTELYLDQNGVSERSGEDRLTAIANNWGIKNNNPCALDATNNAKYAMYINDGRTCVAVEDYYTALGNNPSNYVYNATNFRLRELSFGYTWRDLFGENKNLSVSFVGRNLFFIYKKAPVDPDVSLATGNGMGAFEMFNMPSARTFGFNLKLNF